jgi:Leucine rich repeat
LFSITLGTFIIILSISLCIYFVHKSMCFRKLSHSLHIILNLISCVSQINCESCVDSKTSQKLLNFYSSRENFISITNVSCSINYFDVTSINRLTFNVIYNSESLHTLDLSSNRISEISNGTFEMFSALQVLKLRDNFLRNVEEYYIGELEGNFLFYLFLLLSVQFK